MTADSVALAWRRLLPTLLLGLGVALGFLPAARAAEVGLPPPVGSLTPLVKPLLGDDGLYHQSWIELSFLDLAEEFAKAKAAGKRFVVLFEQRGCPYCARLHTEVLAQRYINDYVRENFAILQLNLWGSREVTDFDGAKLPEKDLAARWGVIFTPTIIFYKDDLTGLAGKWGRELEAVERLALSYDRDTFYDLLVWLRHKIYEHDGNFQRFHIARIAEREALKAATKTENKRGTQSRIGGGDQ